MVCYPVLIGEMSKREIKKNAVAKCTGICYRALNNKLSGRTPFTLPEAKRIRDAFFPGMSLDELFSQDGTDRAR